MMIEDKILCNIFKKINQIIKSIELIEMTALELRSPSFLPNSAQLIKKKNKIKKPGLSRGKK